MKHLLLASMLAGCQVYGPSLLLDGGADVTSEACAAMCGSKCVNLQTDPNNCGTCGHACETGCAGGLCTPTVLATGLGAPHGLVVTGGKVYVANDGSISVDQMSALDGTGLKPFADGIVAPDRLATDDTNLYWTDDVNIAAGSGGSVWYGALSPTVCNPGPPASYYCYYTSQLPSPYGIAVQGSTMFFTTQGATNMSMNGCSSTQWVSSVLSCPLSGCSVGSGCTGGPTTIASGATMLASIAADSKNIYWADFGAKKISFCPQPACTGGPKTFAQGLGGPWDVISDGTTVYFTDRQGGALYSCPTSGCGSSPKQLATGLNDPLLLATDGTTLYATLYKGGSIVACALPDCAGGAVTFAAGLHAPYGIATDSTYVYWSEEGSQGVTSVDGTVSKLRTM